MMSVFENYAKYYDLLYKDKNYSKEADFVDKLIRKYNKNAKSILELGCGTGLHAIALSKKGYSIHGIDFSLEMLKAADQRIKKLDKKDEEKISFSYGDVRDYRDNKKYDSVISLFHIVSYQKTNKEILDTFKTANVHLKKGGTFIFDCWYGPAVLTEGPSVRSKEFENESTKIIRFANPVMHTNKNIVDVNYQILVIDKKNRKMEEIKEKHSMRYLFQPEIELMLNSAGFDMIKPKEWLTGKDPSIKTWGVCFVGRKK